LRDCVPACDSRRIESEQLLQILPHSRNQLKRLESLRRRRQQSDAATTDDVVHIIDSTRMRLLVVLCLLQFAMLTRSFYKQSLWAPAVAFRAAGASSSPSSSRCGARHPRHVIALSMSTVDSVASTLKEELTRLMSVTDRGAKDTNRAQIFQTIDDLSRSGMDVVASDILGDWELLYTDDDVTRASPFFWAFRKALSGIEDPLKVVGPKLLSESIFKITDSIPLKSIGTATQVFTADGPDRGTMLSRIVVKLNPGNFQSVMATTSVWRTTEEPTLIEVEVQKTEVLESTLAKRVGQFVPAAVKRTVAGALGSALPLNGFPSGAALELVKPGSSTVYMRILYMDRSLRVVKNEADGKTFVFGRLL